MNYGSLSNCADVNLILEDIYQQQYTHIHEQCFNTLNIKKEKRTENILMYHFIFISYKHDFILGSIFNDFGCVQSFQRVS